MRSGPKETKHQRRRLAARLAATALFAASVALSTGADASAHVIWTNPAPRAGSQPTDTAAPCGGRVQAAPGTSPAVYQPGAEIGVFFREDHGHTLNYSNARAYFTISFSPGGDAASTELKRIDVSSAPLPRLYGFTIVGDPAYIGVKLPATPTEQGILQLQYHTTDGTPDMYSCADIRIATPPTPPPGPLDVKVVPEPTDDVFLLHVAATNTGTSALTDLTSLVPGGLRISTDAYPPEKRGDVAILFGPVQEIGGSLIPGERRDYDFLLEARAPGFAIASARATAKVGAKLYDDTGLAEIEVARREPTLLDLWANGTGGLAQLYEMLRRDGQAGSARIRAAFYRSLPRWKLGFRQKQPNRFERSLANAAGLDPGTFAAWPDNLGEAWDLYWREEMARTRAIGRVLKGAATTGYDVALKTPFEFYTDANARAAAGPELTRAALEFGAARDAYLGEAWSFWTNKGKIMSAVAETPKLAAETYAEIKLAAARAYKAGVQEALAAGRLMVRDPGAAAERLGDIQGTVQAEVGLAILQDVVGGKVLKALSLVGKATKGARGVEVASDLTELAPTGKSLTPLELGMDPQHADLIRKEVIEPAQKKYASWGGKVELQVRSTNPWTREVKGAVGKIVLIPVKNLESLDVLLGADARALGQAATYLPKLPKRLHNLTAPLQRALKLRYAEKLEEYTAYRAAKGSLTRGGKMERMVQTLKPGGAELTGNFGTKTTRFKMELAEERFGNTTALRYKELVVDGDTIVARGRTPAPVGSDYDINALISSWKAMPAGIRGQYELMIYDGLRKLAVSKGLPFGFHGFTFNGFDVGAKAYPKLFRYILQNLSAEEAARVAAHYAPRFGTTPEKMLADLTHGEFVVKITADGVTTGPGVNPLGP